MKFYILSIFMLVSQLIFAQYKITGKVANKTTGEAIAGATITIQSTSIGTATNANGNYLLNKIKAGSYKVRISSFGYTSTEQIVTVNGNMEENFQLEPSSIDLNAIVVTGTRNARPLDKSPILTQVISGSQIFRQGITYLPQLLNNNDASFETMCDNTVKSLSLQGLNPQYTVFLINGERLAGETKGVIDFSRINPTNIDHIEIVRGASSTLYGSNAIGGVVNIITRPAAEKFGATVGMQSNIYKDPSTDKIKSDNLAFAGINFSQDRLSSFTDFKINFNDPYDLSKSQGVNGFLTQEKEKNFNLSQRFDYRLADNLSLSAYGNYYQLSKNYAAAGYPDRLARNYVYGVKADYYLNSNDKLQLSWHSDQSKYYDEAADDHSNRTLNYNNLMNDLRLLGIFKIGTIQQVTAGAEYIGERQSSMQNNFGTRRTHDFTVYAQDEISITSDFSLTAGVRNDFNSIYGSHFTPQINGLYQLGHFNLRASFGQGFRSPSAKELYTNQFEIPAAGSPIKMFLNGNKNLKPETSNYYSGSVQYVLPKFDFSVMYTHNKVKNLIDNQIVDSMKMVTVPYPMPSVIYYSYGNRGKSDIQTINLMIRYSILPELSVSGSYTYMDANTYIYSAKTMKFEKETLPSTRKNQARISIDYNKSFGKYALDVNLSGSYYGKKTVIDIYSQNQGLITLNDYSLYNLTTVHHFGKYFSVTAGLDNIFDKKDSQPKYFNFQSPGRTYVLGCKIDF